MRYQKMLIVMMKYYTPIKKGKTKASHAIVITLISI